MKDVTTKTDSLRTAMARATLKVDARTAAAVRAGAVPKGDVLATARVAGILAAKRTPELIPMCHALPLDHADVRCEVGDGALQFESTVRTVWKTGVEMEALSAVTVAALTAYDMLKPLDKAMSIEGVHLVEKTGGKSGLKLRLPDRSLRAAVLVVSDGTAAGTRKDKSGLGIKARLEALGVQVLHYDIVADERDAIEGKVRRYVAAKMDLVLTTGGTGLGPRDVTVDTVEGLLERTLPGAAEAMRSYGQRRTPFAMLSRGVAGTIGATLVVTLPGSPSGAAEAMDALFPALLHAIGMIDGGGH